MKVNRVYLDDTYKVKVALPTSEWFVKKLQEEDPFVYLKINHGFFDQLSRYRTWASPYPLPLKWGGGAVKKLCKELYGGRGPFHAHVPYETYEKVIVQAFAYFFKEDRSSTYIGVSNSNGMKAVTTTPKQGGARRRTEKLYELCKNSYRDTWIHGGVLRHHAVLGTATTLFDELNKDKYNVILVGPQYCKEYKALFNFTHHVIINNKNAANDIEGIKTRIINACSSTKKNVVLGSTAILGFSFYHMLENKKISWLDIGRSYDILVRNKIPKQPWFRFPTSYWK